MPKPKQEQTSPSPAAQFILDGWKKGFATTSSSRIGKDHLAQGLVKFAIQYGMKFEDEDFKFLPTWVSGEIGDGHYGLGAASGVNVPFCRAFERARDFAPFILKDQSQSGRRLYPGMERLLWKGEFWHVSSWGGAYQYLNLIQNKHDDANKSIAQGGAVYGKIEGDGRESWGDYWRITQFAKTETGYSLELDGQPLDKSGVNVVTKRTRLTREDVARFNAEAKEAWALLSPLEQEVKGSGGYSYGNRKMFEEYSGVAESLLKSNIKQIREFAHTHSQPTTV